MFKQLPATDLETVRVIVNGQSISVTKGMTVAATVLSQQQKYTRTTAISGSKRAPFCMMGVCYDCVMVINGKANQRACATYVEEGMQIEIQQGAGSDLVGNEL
ncbi:MAG: (2Fe-2S)-binding protein [Methylococcales bacterium]|nr:(2Fe-2S)-binding protein [Methylococcales bacterium]